MPWPWRRVGAAPPGARLDDLARALKAVVEDADDADCAEYLDELIEAQVIEPDLVPAVVGADPLDQIVAALEAAPGLAEPAARLGRLRRTIRQLDAHGVGAPPQAYAAVERVWTGDLGMKRTDRLLQVDLFQGGERLRLPEEVVSEVLRGAEPLRRLAGPAADELGDMKRRFRDRYEGRDVPLAEAFDPECGLGAPGRDLRPLSPTPRLVRGLDLRQRGGHGGEGRRGAFAEVIGARLMDRGARAPAVLELDDDLLNRLAPGEPPKLPDAIGIHFDLLAESEAAIRRGDYRVRYHGAFGPSGARMLGRFCDLDSGLLEGVRRHFREEEALDPDAVYAEIVHTPEGRVGNVVRRPHVRRVELSVTGNSRFEGDARLTVDDLLLSLDGNRFLLRSRRDGRRVVPRLTSAHNFRRSTGMYRFLCALQQDGLRPGFGWGWGSLAALPFLPRVVRGRWIYAPTRWRLTKAEKAYGAIGRAKTPDAREAAARELAAERQLPRFVRLAEGDNRLLLDLGNPLCLRVFADHAARRPGLTLTEVLAEDLEGCVSGPEGKYRNEIILPLVRRREPGRPSRSRKKRSESEAPRVFPPGSDWFYLKLYCAPGIADRVLTGVGAPLAALHRRHEPDRPWFFLRYSDPEPHLRIRFRARREARRLIEGRMESLVGPLVAGGTIPRVSLDTYVREVERYGGAPAIGAAEACFGHDSDAVLAILPLLDEGADAGLRWKAVLMGMDRLLRDFGFDREGRARVVEAARESFGSEFGVGPATRKRLAKRLRGERAAVEAIVAGGDPGSALASIDRIFRRRSERSAGAVARLLALDASGGLDTPLDDVIRSLLHMHVNRMCAGAPRAQELVLHDFLARTYRSLMARDKYRRG